MSAEYEEEYYPPQPTLRANRVYAAPEQRNTEAVPKPCRQRRSFLPVGIGMCIVVDILLLFQYVISPAYTWAIDQWHYGDGWITRLDADVGHGGTSHFIAEYYHSSIIIIIELSLNNLQQFHTYTLSGFMGSQADPVVTLRVQDVNHDGKPDL